MRVIIRTLKSDELEQLLDLLVRAYAEKATGCMNLRKRFQRSVESDPHFNFDLNRVIEVNGKLVSRIQICDRRMYFQGNTLRVGAIAGVCTDPAHRGKGYCKMLLDDCTNCMRENAFDISLLFGEPAIYGKSGWQTLSAFELCANYRMAVDGRTQGRSADLDRDMTELIRLYNGFNRTLNGPFVRSSEYWNQWIRNTILHKGDWRIELLERDGAVIGYAAVKNDDWTKILELAWDRDVAGAREGVMDYLFMKAAGTEIRIACDLPELYEIAAERSQPPSLDDMRRREYSIKRRARYAGLFKRIGGGSNIPASDTKALVCLLRTHHYNFWDLDHF